MKVSDVLREKGRKVYTVSADAPLAEALSRMTRHHIGALVVTSPENPIEGVITERDLLRHLERSGGSLGQGLVRDLMTPRSRLVVATEEDDLEYAMSAMTSNRVRHLPIVGRDKLCGMLSIGDLVKSQLTDQQHENKMLQDYIAGQYPA